MPQLDRPGRFRAEITAWGMAPAKEGSRSRAVAMEFAVCQAWNDVTKGWEDWSHFGMSIRAYLYIIKRDGEPNERQVESLIKAVGWRGSLQDFAPDTEWRPKPCQIVCDWEVYDGKTNLRVQWVNPWDGADMPKADANELAALDAQVGGKLRALAGNIARNAQALRPAAPPPPRQGPPPPIPQSPVEEVPF